MHVCVCAGVCVCVCVLQTKPNKHDGKVWAISLYYIMLMRLQADCLVGQNILTVLFSSNTILKYKKSLNSLMTYMIKNISHNFIICIENDTLIGLPYQDICGISWPDYIGLKSGKSQVCATRSM